MINYIYILFPNTNSSYRLSNRHPDWEVISSILQDLKIEKKLKEDEVINLKNKRLAKFNDITRKLLIELFDDDYPEGIRINTKHLTQLKKSLNLRIERENIKHFTISIFLNSLSEIDSNGNISIINLSGLRNKDYKYLKHLQECQRQKEISQEPELYELSNSEVTKLIQRKFITKIESQFKPSKKTLLLEL